MRDPLRVRAAGGAADQVAADAELPPVIKLADKMLIEGIKSRASDIHVEPEGDSVLVIGCGGVGLAAVAIARSRGAFVCALDVSAASLDRALFHGADEVVDASIGTDKVLAAVSAWAERHMHEVVAAREQAGTTGSSVSVG